MKKVLLALALTAPLLALSGCSDVNPKVGDITPALKRAAIAEMKAVSGEENPMAVTMVNSMIDMIKIEAVKDCKPVESEKDTVVCQVTMSTATAFSVNPEGQVDNAIEGQDGMKSDTKVEPQIETKSLKLSKVSGEWVALP